MSPQQNATDATASFFWYIALLVVAAIIVWIFGKNYIIPVLFYVRSGEIYLIEWLMKGWNFMAHFLGFLHLPEANIKRFDAVLNYMHRTLPREVSLQQFEDISGFVGVWYRYPITILTLVLAYISFFRHRSARFVQNYSMRSLKKVEVENWPEITPVLGLDLVKQKLTEGTWAMATLPMDFCRQHNILKMVQKNDKPHWSIVYGAAERLFVLQMGPLWEGVNKLPPHIKALFVIFVARISRQKNIAAQLLHQLSASAGEDKINYEGVDEYAEQLQTHKAVHWAVTRHTYVYTVMATLLELARSEGVLATAEFIWLKVADRRFWYVLNTVGRTTPVVEVAGFYAHWLAEKKLKRGLRTPVVNEAVKALDEAVGDILYVAEGETWRTNSAA